MKERSARTKESVPTLRDTHPEAVAFVIDHQFALLETVALAYEGCELYPEEQELLQKWEEVRDVVGPAADAFLQRPSFATTQEAVSWIRVHGSFVEEAKRKKIELKKVCRSAANQDRDTQVTPEQAISLNEEMLLRTARCAMRAVGPDTYHAIAG